MTQKEQTDGPAIVVSPSERAIRVVGSAGLSWQQSFVLRSTAVVQLFQDMDVIVRII